MPVICPPSSELPVGTVTYLHAWNSIVRKVRANPQNSAGGVVILAAIDLVSHAPILYSGKLSDGRLRAVRQDALLASHVLVNLFKQEDIPHSLIPIGGYTELETRKDQIFGSEDGRYPGNPDVSRQI